MFSFHIHDGDFWMYTLYANGQVVDQFNPIPDYFDDNISEEEIASWRGNAASVSEIVGSVSPKDIEKYLVRWNLDADESSPAYPDDTAGQEDWQLLDFMRKLGLPYPLLDDGTPQGETYKLWTAKLRLEPDASGTSGAGEDKPKESSGKPWWKLW